MPTTYLVACTARKREDATVAKDLYCSDWFRKARALAERAGDQWFILSAQHGLVHPDDMLEPYDKTLFRMSAADRRAWGTAVIQQMNSLGLDAPNCQIIFLAGAFYREHLQDWAGNRGYAPMRGLKIGQQLAWLKAQISQPARQAS